MSDPPPPPADPATSLKAKIAELDAQIAALSADLARLESERDRNVQALNTLLGLTTSKSTVNVKAMLHKSRVRHSGGRGKASALVKAANAANLTMEEVAGVLGCSPALLSAAAHGKKSISMGYAQRIETLLGNDSEGNPRYPATAASWPMLRSE